MRDKIIIVTPPAAAPASFYTDGNFLLDVDEDFAFDLTANVAELTDINELKADGVLGFSIPMSDKNMMVFAPYIGGASENVKNDPIPVVCIAGGAEVLQQDLLIFKKAKDAPRGSVGEIEVELVASEDFWLTVFERTTINQVDFGTFAYTVENMFDNWPNEYWHEVNGNVWHPLVHMGAFARPQDDFYGCLVDDFLPWLSVNAFLVLSFRYAGWLFESPLGEGEGSWLPRLWMYLNKTDFVYENQGAGIIASATKDQTQNPVVENNFGSIPINFFTRDSDPAGALHDVPVGQSAEYTTVYANTRPIATDFEVTANLLFTHDGPFPYPVKLDVALIELTQNTQLDIDENIIIQDGAVDEEVEVVLRGNLDFGQRLYLRVQGMTFLFPDDTTLPGTILVTVGSTMTVRPISQRVYLGDTLNIQDVLDPNLTILDVLKGIVHLGAFKLHTNWLERTVTMYPTEFSSVFNEYSEGFYHPPTPPLDVSPYIADGTREVNVVDSDRNRFFQLRFQDTNDGFIEKEELEANGPLYGKLVDMGSGDITKPAELKNPLFEPMAEINWHRARIPVCWEEQNPKVRSLNIGYRIMYAVGYVRQLDESTVNTPVSWVFETRELVYLPYGSMLPRKRYLQAGTGTPTQSFRSVVYGGAPDGEEDLEFMFWRHELRDRRYTRTFEFICVLPLEVYLAMDFRTRLQIEYRGVTILAKQISKIGYLPGKDETMQLLVKPENTQTDG